MDTTPSPHSIGPAPSAPPSPPITSWPATDIGSTATADYDGPVPTSAARFLVGSSPIPAIEFDKSLAPLDTQFETASVSSELEDETPTVESPVSAVKIDEKGPARPFEAAPRPAGESKEKVNAGIAPESATICGENEFASQTFTNHAAPNSAVSPKTFTFFSGGVRVPLGVPFPPHQSGAFNAKLCPFDAEGQETKMRREPKHKQNVDEHPASRSTGFCTRPLTSPNGSNRQRGLSPGHRHRSRSHTRSRSNSRNRRHKSSEPKTRPHIVHSRTIVSAYIPKLKSVRKPASEHTDRVTITALIRELKSALEHEPIAFYTFKGVLAEFEETRRNNFETREQRNEKVRRVDFSPRKEPAFKRTPARMPPRGAPQFSMTHTDSDSETETETHALSPQLLALAVTLTTEKSTRRSTALATRRQSLFLLTGRPSRPATLPTSRPVATAVL
ncbi:hypothetical protein JCM21900_005629 [Sporobolomyces salmonicolor]